MWCWSKGSFKIPAVQENHVPKDIPKTNISIFKGLLYATLSGIFYSLSAVIVKEMTSLFPGQLVAYRYAATLAFSLPEAFQSGENLLGPKHLRITLIIRGLCGGSHSVLSFLAFRYLSLGDASIILFSFPAFVILTARIFMKEPCGLLQAFTIFLTIVGVAFTAKLPTFFTNDSFVYSGRMIYGIVAAICAVVFNTCQFLILRKLRNIHHSVIVFHFGCVAFIESVILTAIFGYYSWQYCGVQSFYAALLGLLSYLEQNFIILALKLETTGTVSIMRAVADIVLSFLWQVFFFHDDPDVFSIIGGILVGLSFILVALKKWVSNLPNDFTKFKYLKWMLK